MHNYMIIPSNAQYCRASQRLMRPAHSVKTVDRGAFMKVAIIGAGALGSVLAALLAKAGEDVVIIERDRRVRQAIDDRGLRYDGTGGEQRLPVPVRESAAGFHADAVFLCARSGDTASAIEKAREAVSARGHVICFQDGLGRFDLIREAFGDGVATAGWTGIAGTLVEPGHVLHSGWGDTRLAPGDPAYREQAEIPAANLTRAGIKTQVVDDAASLLWTKTVVQSGVHAVATIGQLANGRLLEVQAARDLMNAAIEEAAQVARGAGIGLLFDNPTAQARRILEMTETHLCSMLQDLYRKRPLEVEFINGAVINLARAHGLSAPINETLYRLLKTIEASRQDA